MRPSIALLGLCFALATLFVACVGTDIEVTVHSIEVNHKKSSSFECYSTLFNKMSSFNYRNWYLQTYVYDYTHPTRTARDKPVGYKSTPTCAWQGNKCTWASPYRLRFRNIKSADPLFSIDLQQSSYMNIANLLVGGTNVDGEDYNLPYKAETFHFKENVGKGKISTIMPFRGAFDLKRCTAPEVKVTFEVKHPPPTVDVEVKFYKVEYDENFDGAYQKCFSKKEEDYTRIGYSSLIASLEAHPAAGLASSDTKLSKRTDACRSGHQSIRPIVCQFDHNHAANKDTNPTTLRLRTVPSKGLRLSISLLKSYGQVIRNLEPIPFIDTFSFDQLVGKGKMTREMKFDSENFDKDKCRAPKYFKITFEVNEAPPLALPKNKA